MNLHNKRWLRAITISSCLTFGAISNVNAQTIGWAIEAAQGDDNQYITTTSVDDAGNVYAGGFFNSPEVFFDAGASWSLYNSGTGEDGFLAKYDQTGTVVWSLGVGGTGNDRITGVSAFHNGNEDDNIYVTGTFNGTMTLNSAWPATTTIALVSAGSQDAFVAKYDNEGALIWAYRIGGSGADNAYSISANTDITGGNARVMYIAGRHPSNTGFSCVWGLGSNALVPSTTYGSDDGYLVKYIDNGTTATASWIKVMGSVSGADSYYCVSSNGYNVSAGGLIRATANAEGAAGTLTISGSYDIVATCYTSGGTNVWANRYGTTGTSLENATSIAIDQSNNTYIGGYCASGYLSCNTGGWEAMVLKINSTGATTWTSCGGSSNDDYVQGIAIDKCSKRVYVAGVYKGSFSWGTASLTAYNGTPDNDGFMLTLDASDGTYMTGTANRFGGVGADVVYSVSLNRLNKEYIAGVSQAPTWKIGSTTYFTNPYAPSNTNYDSFLARWVEGTWPAEGSNPGFGSYAEHKGLNVLDCNLYACGTMFYNATFGSIALTSTVNTIGNSTNDIYMTRANRFGNYDMFLKVVSGNADEQLVAQTMDASGNLYLGGFAQTGTTTPNVTFNTSPSATTVSTTLVAKKALILQTNANGVTQWYDIGQPTTSSGQAHVTGVALDASGYVYVCGGFTGTVTFSGTTNITSAYASGEDAFIAKYSSSGVLQWVKAVAQASVAGVNITPYGISVDASGYIYITGTYAGLTAFNGNMISVPLNAGTNGNDIFVTQYSSAGYALKALGYTGSVNRDQGQAITATDASNVFVTGYSNVSSQRTFTGKCNFSGTPAWTWTKSATTQINYPYAIVKDATDIYVTGFGYSGSVFGAKTQSTTGYYVTKYAQSNGTEAYCSSRATSLYARGSAIALDNVVVNNVFVAGYSPAFIDQLSSDVGNLARLGNMADNSSNISTAPSATTIGTLYPNPSDGSMMLQLSIDIDESTPVSLLMTDITGRIVLQQEGITTAQTPVEGAALANGTYYYQVVKNNEVIGNGKIVIAR
ncbi:MAG: T9SS type A sorting domain-containing protein [Bacteroidota bacterium]|nr:T9SS type A sorting domain-containing protein [Bacteroidota bacterium]